MTYFCSMESDRLAPVSGNLCTVVDPVTSAGQGFFWSFVRIRDMIARAMQFLS